MLIGCSGTPNVNSAKLEEIAYIHPQLGFSIQVPKGWTMIYEDETVGQFVAPIQEPTDDGKDNSTYIPGMVISVEELTNNGNLEEKVQEYIDSYLKDEKYDLNITQFDKNIGTYNGLPSITVTETLAKKVDPLNIKKAVSLFILSERKVYDLSFETTGSTLEKYLPSIYASFETFKIREK